MAKPAPDWRKTVHLIQQLSLPKGREQLGLFTLEGYRSMERALRNGAPLEEVLVGEDFVEAPNQRQERIVREVLDLGVPMRVAPVEEVRRMTGGRGLGNVFAVMRQPPPPEWEEMFSVEGRKLVVVGWNLGDPGNTGAVIRSALAAGASAFLAVGTTDPWHPKSVRTSMGSLFAIPILRTSNEEWIERFHDLGVETFATVCRDAEPLPSVRLHGERMALVMGSEAFGLPDEIANRLKRRVTIPMPSGVDSYSINAATAVLAYTLMQKVSTNPDMSCKVPT
ncbi:MAG: RNA methyltransferase [Verrucomicrobia bacterium]|nr:RNA methyltransferase [Verrucomicrobiota bacterium]MCH8512239.1 RNA methyltransferase [Kiritimatiellia bacterium]